MKLKKILVLFILVSITYVVKSADFSTTITSTAGSTTNVSPIPFQIQFGMSVADFVVGDITVTNGTKGALSGSGDTYTIDITPTGQGNVIVTVAAGVATNASDKNLLGTLSVTYDNIAPTLAIFSSDKSTSNSSGFTLTIEFSEDVVGFDVSDVTVSNGTKGALSVVTANRKWTLPVTSTSATSNCSISASVCTDAGGNNNDASGTVTVTYDNTPPTLTIFSSDKSVSNSSGFTLTIEFSEDVVGFDVSDVTVSNGTKGALSVVTANRKWTLPVTSTSATSNCSISASVCTDAGGNNNDASGTVTVTYDNTAPTLTTFSSDKSVSNSSGFTLTIEFSEDVVGFDVSDVTVSNGTKGALSVVTANRKWTLPVTSTSATSNCSISASVCTDAGGNNNDASGTVTVTYDNTAPTLTTFSSDKSTSNSSGFTLTIEFSEDVVGFDVSDVTVSNGTKGALSVVTANRKWTLPVTSTSATSNCSISASVCTDAGGNNNDASGTVTVTYDNTAPTLTTFSSDKSTSNSSGFTLTIEFSEDVVGFDVSDVTVSNGTKGALSVVTANRKWTLPVTSTSATSNCSISAGVCTDGAGNNNTASGTVTVTYDNTSPTVSNVTSDDANATLMVGQSIDIKVVFSETVFITGTPQLTLETGTVDQTVNCSSGTGTNTLVFHYIVQVGDLNGDLDYVNTTSLSGTIKDAAGNLATLTLAAPGANNSLGKNKNFVVDGVAPLQPTISGLADGTFNTNKTATVTFSEGGGTKEYSINNGSTWSNYSSPVSLNSDGTTYYFIARQTDAAGNVSPVSSLYTVTIDKTTQAPVLTGPADNSSSTSDGKLTITYNLPKAALGGTVKLTFECTGVPSGYSSISDRFVTLKPICESVGAHSFDLDARNFLDAANSTWVLSATTGGSEGNRLINGGYYKVHIEYKDVLGNAVGTDFSSNIFFSSGPPTADFLSITPDPRNYNIPATEGVTLTFSWRVNRAEVQIDHFTLTKTPGGSISLSGVTITPNEDYSGTARDYKLDLSGVTNLAGTYLLTFDPTGTSATPIKDRTGNAIVTGATKSWVIDKTAPTVDLTYTGSDPTNAATMPFSAVFSEHVVGLVSGGITVVNGSVTSLTTTDNKTYDIVVTPVTEGNVQVTVPLAACKDDAGNDNTASSTVTAVSDKTGPTVTISTVKTTTNANPIPISIQFSENVTGFTSADIVLTGFGSLSGFTPVSGSLYTFNFTPTTDGSITVDIPAGVCTDAAINGNSVASQLTIISDRTNPEINALTITSNNTFNSGYVGVGGIVTLNITGSENLSLVAGDVKIEGQDAILTGSNKNWTATYTMQSSDVTTPVTYKIDFKDLAGNAVVGTTTPSTLVFDKVAPTLTSVSMSSTNTPNYTAKVGDVVTIFFTADDDIRDVGVLINNTKNAIVTDLTGRNWKAEYTMSTLDVEGVVTFKISFKDYAGNASSPNPVTTITTGSTVTFDKTAPSAPSAPNMADASDLGTSNTDNITSLATPTFTGTSEINAVVKLYSNVDGLIGTNTPDGTVSWLVTASSLTEGNHIITVTATDATGNVSPVSGSLTITIDRTTQAAPPAPSLSAASNSGLTSDNITNVTNATLTGTTADAYSVVKLYNGTSLMATTPTTITSNLLGIWTATITLTTGSNSITATATDAAGNVSSASPALDVTLDVNAPTSPAAPVLALASNSGSSADNITNVNTPIFTGTAENSSTVDLYRGTTLVGTTTANATDGSWSITSTVLSDGGHVMTATATDVAGNTSSASSALNITIDTGNPAKPSTPVLDGTSNSGSTSDNVTNDDTPTITGTVTEIGLNITLYSDGSIIGSGVSDASKNWSIISNSLTNGAHEITAIATDVAGNVSSISNGYTIIIDNLPPVISSITVPSGVYKVGSTIIVTIIADNSNYTNQTLSINGVDQSLVNLYDNTYKANYLVVEGNTERNAVSALPISIVLKDIAGNMNVAETSATVSGGTLTINSSTPLISTITSNAETTGILKIGDPLIFTVTPTVQEAGLIITPTTYNGKTINWATINTGLTYTATYTVQEGDADQTSGLGLGTVTITDAAGNTSSSIYNSVQKKIFGTRPTYEISGGGSRCASSAGLSVTYTFTGVQPYKLKIKKDGVIASSYVDVTSNSYTVTGVLSGTYELGELIDATTNVATEVTSKKAIVTENVNPSITFTPSTLSYNKNDPEVNLMNFVNIDARGGTFSGEGVGSDGYFYPVLIKMGTNSSVTKAISYSVTNAFACTSSKNINITVTLDGGYFSGIDPKYCKNSSAPTSVVVTVLGAGSTSGESFTIIPASNKTSTLAKDKFEINPKEMKAGVYTLKYHYTNTANGNSYDINNNFTIDSLSALLDFTIPSSKYCNNDPISYTLSAVNANNTAGGKAYWSGPATGFTAVVNTNNALLTPSAVTFDPLEVSKEISITYHYESNDGCISSPITRTTTVYAPPVVDFTLKDNYNFDGASELLIGNYSPQGTFSSDKNIIVSSKTITPSNISTSDLGASAKVTYTYTDTNTGCTNTKDRTTIIYKATTPILGLDEKYCFGNIVKTITCNPTDGGNPIGVFTSKLNAISNNLGNSAQYDIGSITNLGDGIDTVKFTYFIGSTEYQVIRRVVIDYIGEVSMNIVNNSDFCKDVTSVPIFGLHPHHSSGNGELVISPLSTSFVTGSGNADFKPSLETIGKHTITYTYTSSIYNNCKSSASIDVWVNPVPVANFEIGEACPGTEKDVPFVNTSTIPSGATMTWNWSFEVGQTATGKDPLYRFKSTGLKSVSLVAKTEKNCQSTAIKPITVGINAKANFSWDNECLIENDSIKFTNKTTGGNTKTAKWIFNGNQISDSISFFKQKFTDLGRYDLKLIIKTVDGCADTVTKSIIIQPYIKFLKLPDLTYYQNFESSNSNYNWQTKGISDAFSSKWYLGKPDGSTINIAKSGDNAWFTKITKQDDIENSQVVSPCFDFTGLKKPMIKMDIWSSSEAKRDGAVLQYSLDKGNMWENLGTKGEGQNWFNSDVILTNPAGQIEGWSQLPMTQWTDARHSLDNLVNAKNVRFRIVYAKDATNSEKVDGFAFDNVWIGERQQYVLNEYFTDMTQTSANSYMHQIQVNGKQDIIPIQLHKDDDLYKDYTAGPSSRIFYYGVSQLPYIVSNGQITSSLASADNKTDYKKLINTEILNDPKISITQNNTKTSVGITLTALTDLSNENLVLYCAVVKDSILVGGKYYYNVLRKFYPNPGGIAIPTSGFIGGQTTTLSIPIDFNNSPELIGSKLVIFVQNSIDNKVYQVISYKVTTSTAVDPNSISNKVDIYPNPASDYLMIDCEYSIDRLVIYDVSGRVVGSFVPSMARYSLPLQNYDKGIYIIKGSTRKGDFVKKFIKQ